MFQFGFISFNRFWSTQLFWHYTTFFHIFAGFTWFCQGIIVSSENLNNLLFRESLWKCIRVFSLINWWVLDLNKSNAYISNILTNFCGFLLVFPCFCTNRFFTKIYEYGTVFVHMYDLWIIHKMHTIDDACTTYMQLK